MDKKLLKYGIENPDEFEVASALACFAKGLTIKFCAFCHGWGHYASKCPTKATIDHTCKFNPEWKVVWGTIKANQKHYAAKGRAKDILRSIKETKKKGETPQNPPQTQQQQQQQQPEVSSLADPVVGQNDQTMVDINQPNPVHANGNTG
uniref:Orf1 n=1 Tax=Stylonychia lemnae TaxID=5949 RepID=Q94744_STYLE|nr:orf1 [Stylonychia lemnae]